MSCTRIWIPQEILSIVEYTHMGYERNVTPAPPQCVLNNKQK